MAEVYHDQDIDMKVLDGKRVAVIGYGSQGRAQALNMGSLKKMEYSWTWGPI